jgi:Flp pilus assembly protein TadG
MLATSMFRALFRMRLAAARLLSDSSGIAATEFAFIVPIMLVMFFGTVEMSSGVAVDRKVTFIARTLSDLTGQAPATDQAQTYAQISDTYIQNVFTASIAIITPYLQTPVKSTISEIYVDKNAVAKIQWSKAATISSGATQATLTSSSRNAGDTVTSLVPTALLIKQTYLIFSEVSYLYTPTIGYVMAPAGVTISDVSYTRPRQATCVVYNSLPAQNPAGTNCPLL